ncbi:hypothetical protein LINPERPRIM_LOCUS8772 [Linum perenne]
MGITETRSILIND